MTMDPLDAPRSDLVDTIVVVACIAVGLGAIGFAAWVAAGELRQRWRYRGIGR